MPVVQVVKRYWPTALRFAPLGLVVASRWTLGDPFNLEAVDYRLLLATWLAIGAFTVWMNRIARRLERKADS